MESRANSLRAYAENLMDTKNQLDEYEITDLGDDLIEFAEQWEAELKQQSPAVAVPVLMEYLDQISIINNTVNYNGKRREISTKVQQIRSMLSAPTPNAKLKQRITEQDAREIIHSMVGYREYEQTIFETEFEYWIKEKGRPLLAKLNKHCEPDYKAQIDAAGILIRPKVTVE